jgi:glutaminase
MGLHLMSTDERYGIHPIREVEVINDAWVVRLQGVMNFSAAESILFRLEDYEITAEQVLLDFSQVTSVNRIARVMLKEGLRRMRESGFQIGVIDPEELVKDRTMRDGTEVRRDNTEDYMIEGEELW